MLDFHCHLDFPDYDADRWSIIDQFFQAGGKYLVTVSDPVEKNSMANTREIQAYRSGIYVCAGIHPHHADSYNPGMEKDLIGFLESSRSLGLGEIGLDFHYNHSTPENQKKVFRRQLELAMTLQLPVIIHSRQAEDQVLKILTDVGFDQPVVFHCYTGNTASAREIFNRGYFISISGIITFKKAEELRQIIRGAPPAQLFTETDSPFLSPEPHRGCTNNPSQVRIISETMAGLQNTPINDFQQQILKNFQEFLLLTQHAN